MGSDLLDDTLYFQPAPDDEAEQSDGSEAPLSVSPWKVLLVDDESAVHEVTRLSLRDMSFQGRRVMLYSTYSANEACAFLGANEDIALILLDVVMEHDNAGFDVVEYVRHKLKDRITRIVLRTGLPGEAPEQSIMVDYDIDDYREKTDLSHSRLLTTVISALRAYRNLHELKCLNAEMEQRVRRRTDELRLAKEAAEEANRAKSDFLAVISHEIRTPLNSVIAMADLLVKGRLDPDSHDLASTIHDSGKILLHIINDILDFSKLESGPVALEVVPVNLNDLLEQVVSLLSAKIGDKPLELSYVMSDETPELIDTDPTRLKQILLNLVSNALRFTEVGWVSIEVDYNPILAHLYLQVEDTGIGIDEAKLEHIFEPFTQADTSTTRKYGGTGLGLAICKRLTDRMGGKISVHSIPNKGSRFEIGLPAKRTITEVTAEDPALKGLTVSVDCASAKIEGSLESMLKRLGVRALAAGNSNDAFDCRITDQAPAAGHDTAPGTIRLMDHTSENVYPEELVLRRPLRRSRLAEVLRRVRQPMGVSAPDKPTAMPERGPGVCPLTALVVDDNAINRRVLQRILQTIHCDPVLVGGGMAALAHLRQQPVDIVFLDLQMPDLDGYGVMKELRSMSCSAHTRVVAVTASAFGSDRERCLAAGMDAFLTKPVILSDVIDVITQVMPKALAIHPVQEATLSPARTEWNDCVLLNKETIRSLRDLRLLDEFVGEFDARVADGLERLLSMDCIEADREITLLAHELKGASANVGAQALANLMSTIEQQGCVTEDCARQCRALFQQSKQALAQLIA